MVFLFHFLAFLKQILMLQLYTFQRFSVILRPISSQPFWKSTGFKWQTFQNKCPLCNPYKISSQFFLPASVFPSFSQEKKKKTLIGNYRTYSLFSIILAEGNMF